MYLEWSDFIFTNVLASGKPSEIPSYVREREGSKIPDGYKEPNVVENGSFGNFDSEVWNEDNSVEETETAWEDGERK